MATRSYRIYWNLATHDPPGGVPVTAEIPEAWTEAIDATGAPNFVVPGLGMFSKPAITAIAAAGADDRARLDWLAQQQFGDDLAGARRADRGSGTWIVATRADGRVLARLLVPAAAPGVVIASVLLAPDEASRLPEIEGALDTVRVG